MSNGVEKFEAVVAKMARLKEEISRRVVQNDKDYREIRNLEKQVENRSNQIVELCIEFDDLINHIKGSNTDD